ncbi:MAG: hypothetical protein HKN40_00810 [Winogradskyella sp.]|uniref:hypothetical protein n=1 Tax=Winogradskyella sp. TaxID=1883156 RepID=UPI0017A534B9|nr:hypothetical protein [Winogradskyella sp.]
MYKILYIFVLISFVSVGHAQKSTLLPNVNFRAKELKHSLNSSGDSLLLQSDRTIYSVDIFNQDYDKTVRVEGTEVKIPLEDTPVGRLVVQAKMVDKRILMTLLRHEPYHNKLLAPESTLKTSKIVKLLPALAPRSKTLILPTLIAKKATTQLSIKRAINAKLNFRNFTYTNYTKDRIKINSNANTVASLLNSRLKQNSITNQTFYWTLRVVNNGTRTYKTMKLVNEATALKMIDINKLETTTTEGKLNTLIVWEVYDKTQFMKLQLNNPELLNATSSELFNVIPYFITENFLADN